MLKECPRHGEWTHSVQRNGYAKCRRCMYEAVKRRRAKVKTQAIEYKGGCCEKCGYSKCIQALEFHHVDPAEKDFSVSSNTHNKSWEAVKAELDKCILVCANCHREIHAELGLDDR